MAKHDQKVEDKRGQKGQYRTKSQKVEGSWDQNDRLVSIEMDNKLAVGDSTLQTDQLGNPDMQSAQRISIASEIGRVQGNRHLQRAIASQKQDKKPVIPISQKSGTPQIQRMVEYDVPCQGRQARVRLSPSAVLREIRGGEMETIIFPATNYPGTSLSFPLQASQCQFRLTCSITVTEPESFYGLESILPKSFMETEYVQWNQVVDYTWALRVENGRLVHDGDPMPRVRGIHIMHGDASDRRMTLRLPIQAGRTGNVLWMAPIIEESGTSLGQALGVAYEGLSGQRSWGTSTAGAASQPRIEFELDPHVRESTEGERGVGRMVQPSPLQRSSNMPFKLDDETASRINQERGGGQPLGEGLRKQMEAALGYDFSGMRVHTSPEADSLNRELGAKAFTTGQNVFFREGAYNPHSSGGQELIAHELTHVVQQNTGAVGSGGGRMTVNAPGDAFEQEADAVAKAVNSPQMAAEVQRQEEEEEEIMMQPIEEEEEELQMQPIEEEEEELMP